MGCTIYLFNANYAYDNRYLLSFSFAEMVPQTLVRMLNMVIYSVSGGWNIHQEEFSRQRIGYSN